MCSTSPRSRKSARLSVESESLPERFGREGLSLKWMRVDLSHFVTFVRNGESGSGAGRGHSPIACQRIPPQTPLSPHKHHLSANQTLRGRHGCGAVHRSFGRTPQTTDLYGHGCGGGRRMGAGVAIAGAVHSGGAGHAGVEVRAGWSGLGGQPDAQLGCAHS